MARTHVTGSALLSRCRLTAAPRVLALLARARWHLPNNAFGRRRACPLLALSQLAPVLCLEEASFHVCLHLFEQAVRDCERQRLSIHPVALRDVEEPDDAPRALPLRFRVTVQDGLACAAEGRERPSTAYSL